MGNVGQHFPGGHLGPAVIRPDLQALLQQTVDLGRQLPKLLIVGENHDPLVAVRIRNLSQFFMNTPKLRLRAGPERELLIRNNTTQNQNAQAQKK